MSVILPSPVKVIRGSKGMVLLLTVWAYLFKFNDLIPQDRPVAAPPMSSGALVLAVIKPSQLRVIWLASNDNNTTNDDVEQIVSFNNDEDTLYKTFPGFVDIGGALKGAAVPGRIHELRDFLSRPVMCQQGMWSVLDTAGSHLVTMDMPAHIMSNVSLQEKFRGYYGFRAKLVIRVQLNAQRFQQGRLLLHYLPTNGLSAERLTTANYNRTYMTQHPRVDLDATESEAILEVPYVSPYLYYDLTTGAGSFGTFWLSVYSVLTTASTPTDCSYSVWCHFEDVEVVYPTMVGATGPLVAQSGRIRRGAGPGSISTIDSELKGVGLGPISGFLKRVSTASGILAEVPMISSVAAPTAWVASVLSRSAQALGFSKPTCAAPPQPVQLRGFAHMNNANSADHSMKMSLMTDNSIRQLPGFAGTNLDEMSIPYICSIPAYIRTHFWDSTQVEGTVLGYCDVSPFKFNPALPDASLLTTDALTGFRAYHCSPMSYISSMFRRWRGGINLTFKVIKTEFHSGRLLCTFTPGMHLSTFSSYTESQYVFREIFDLRDSNEFNVTIPYVALQPWMDVTSATGRVALFVLNELRAPDSVAQSVQILFEVSAAPDFELQFPTSTRVFTPGFVQSQSGYRSLKEALARSQFYSQAGLAKNNVGGGQLATAPVSYSEIDKESIPDRALEASEYCSGEAIQSLRQLLKRFCPVFLPPVALTGGIACYAPYAACVQSYNVGARVSVSGMFTDMVSYLAPLFAVQRGSIRLKVQTDDTDKLALSAAMGYNLGTTSASIFSNNTGSEGADAGVVDNRAVTFSQFTGGIEIEIPPYQRSHCYIQSVLTPTLATQVGSNLFPDQFVVFKRGVGSAFSANTLIWRAAGDDYSLGFFLGAIPLLAPS